MSPIGRQGKPWRPCSTLQVDSLANQLAFLLRHEQPRESIVTRGEIALYGTELVAGKRR